MADKLIQVEVAYATPKRQKIIILDVVEGTTLIETVVQSQIADFFPEIDLTNLKLGIFGKAKLSDTIIQEKDRVEIYRPLIIDPKESRRRRAEKAKTKQ